MTTSDASTAGCRPAEINREFYASCHPGQDDYWRKMAAPRHRVRVLRRLLAAEPPVSVVDLGCGNGLLLREIQSQHPAAALLGIDLSEPQIEDNRRALPGIEWLVLDLERRCSPPPDLQGRFDAVTASEIIEHLSQPEVFLNNALILARPGSGRLLLSTQSGPVRETERRIGHHRHFSQQEMTSLLHSSGWQPIHVFNCGFPFHDLSKWWANRNPDATMRRFAGKRYGVVENLICLALRFAFLLNSRRHGAQLFAIARRPAAPDARRGAKRSEPATNSLRLS